MGGFEGGDEAGFWEVETYKPKLDRSKQKEKSYIKKNGPTYSIKAREKDLFDTISFVPCNCEHFTIEGCDSIVLESNIIYQAYQALVDFTDDFDMVEFFHEHKVVVDRAIPVTADFDLSSSHAAAFILLVKEACNLILTRDELLRIGSSINSDIPLFIDKYIS